MMRQDQPPDPQERGPSFQELAGWPATVGTRRMERARQHIDNPAALQDDPQVAQDAEMLYLAIAVGLYPITINTGPETVPVDPLEGLRALIELVREVETEHAFGGLILDTDSENPEFLEARHIFVLLRHPEWMGASAYLPSLKDKQMTVFESAALKNRPGLFLATPVDCIDPHPGEARFPEGEPELLKTVALWHAAASCHWVPNHGRSGGDEHSPDPKPALALALA